MNTEFEPGQSVIVTHLQGEEVGIIESINFRSGKVLIYFDFKECPHFTNFNISQLQPLISATA